MSQIEKRSRKHFTKQQKLEILNELKTRATTITQLAREKGIHPVTLHNWKRIMHMSKNSHDIDIRSILKELEDLKEENAKLKEVIGDISLDKLILKTSNDIYKKNILKEKLSTPSKSSRKSKKKRK